MDLFLDLPQIINLLTRTFLTQIIFSWCQSSIRMLCWCLCIIATWRLYSLTKRVLNLSLCGSATKTPCPQFFCYLPNTEDLKVGIRLSKSEIQWYFSVEHFLYWVLLIALPLLAVQCSYTAPARKNVETTQRLILQVEFICSGILKHVLFSLYF